MNPLRPLLGGCLVALSLAGSPAHAGFLVDPDSDPAWTEAEYVLPPPPNPASLYSFFVSSASPNQFLIDEGSLSIGSDGVVRYVLVVRTPGGAENVTFEGIRCATGEVRTYALGRSNGEWVPARSDAWRTISNNSYNRHWAALFGEYLCDSAVPPRDKDEIARRLRGTQRRPLQATP